MSEYVKDPFSNLVYTVNKQVLKDQALMIEKELAELGYVKVIRCRDCRFYQPKEGAMLSCKFEYHGFTQWKLAEPDGFCAWAKRRDA